MVNSTEVITFNGKQVAIRYASGWGDPGQWCIMFDDKSELLVEDARGALTQAEYIELALLPQAEKGNVFAKQLIQDIFTSDWKNVGIEEDVIALALHYVGYNTTNRTVDITSIQTAHNKIAVSLRILASYVESENFDGKRFTDQLNIETARYKELELNNRAATQRVSVFDKITKSERAGNEWTTASFYGNTKDSEVIARINLILADKA